MPFDLHAALEHIRDRGRMLILTHDNPDPDSLACALGLQVVAARVGVQSTIGLAGIVGRAENRAMLRELEIEMVPVERLRPADFRLFALVDTQPGAGNNSLFPDVACDIVIDHHPARPESMAAPWCDIREDVGASAMIVHGYLKDLGLPPDKRLATALLYAIKSETRDLGREAGEEERAAYLDLFPRADHDKLHLILSPKLGRDHFDAVDRALRNAEVRGALVTVNLGRLVYPDLVAEVADMLLPFEAAHWVLCAGHHDGTVYVSLRSDITTARCGDLIRSILGVQGAGGGHGMVAGGRLHGPVDDEAALDAIVDELAVALASRVGVTAGPVPLLRR